jgi:hypothetical protein
MVHVLGLDVPPPVLGGWLANGGGGVQRYQPDERCVALLMHAVERCSYTGLAWIAEPATGVVLAEVRVLEGCFLVAANNVTTQYVRPAEVRAAGGILCLLACHICRGCSAARELFALYDFLKESVTPQSSLRLSLSSHPAWLPCLPSVPTGPTCAP